MKGVCRTNQLKRMLIVHSLIYYEYDESLVSDEQWDAWALELVDRINNGKDTDLHKDAFKDFKGETGMHLVMREYRGLAERLLNHAEREE